jgi:hypothetical protein
MKNILLNQDFKPWLFNILASLTFTIENFNHLLTTISFILAIIYTALKINKEIKKLRNNGKDDK